MMLTICEKIELPDKEYPFSVEFDGFFYYETIKHDNTLVYLPTGKAINNFKVKDGDILLNVINQKFGLDLENITIYGRHNEYYCSSTKTSCFFYSCEKTPTGIGNGQFIGKFTFDLEEMVNWDKIPEEKVFTREYSVDIGEDIPPSEEARPPTE